ncbi:hypothetical protein PENSPDRAFT_672734 [Peniophora sp. CONT]|nr:hypothetical protein PENSPDRAFT_672734 [Peniophora sp. CONT]
MSERLMLLIAVLSSLVLASLSSWGAFDYRGAATGLRPGTTTTSRCVALRACISREGAYRVGCHSRGRCIRDIAHARCNIVRAGCGQVRIYRRNAARSYALGAFLGTGVATEKDYRVGEQKGGIHIVPAETGARRGHSISLYFAYGLLSPSYLTEGHAFWQTLQETVHAWNSGSWAAKENQTSPTSFASMIGKDGSGVLECIQAKGFSIFVVIADSETNNALRADAYRPGLYNMSDNVKMWCRPDKLSTYLVNDALCEGFASIALSPARAVDELTQIERPRLAVNIGPRASSPVSIVEGGAGKR